MPVIGNVARVFTFTQYEREEDADILKVNLPALENTGNSELERRVNYEIQYQMNGLVEEARQRAREYKQAFLETGGREEVFLPTEIFVDYTASHATATEDRPSSSKRPRPPRAITLSSISIISTWNQDGS